MSRGYTEAIELTSEIVAALESGELRLRTGQWIKQGATLSRWVGVSPSGVLWMEHSRSPDKTVFSSVRFGLMVQGYKRIWKNHTDRGVNQ